MSIPTEGALRGIRVLDLSRVLGGPYCTQTLGDHGADVIKVEPPMGDETREWGPPYQGDQADGMSSYYVGINRNKRGIALDLRKPEAQAIVLRLLEGTDILVENFKAGTMERWGLGYDEVLKEKFPRLIYCRVTGFGIDGPLGGFPGYDAVVQAMGGLISVNGSEESGGMRVGVPTVDMATATNATIGILLALQERNRSGKGQLVEASLYDAAIALQHPHAANWFMNGQIPKLTGNSHPNVFPYALYETATRPMFLGVGNDRQFRIACELLGVPELIDDDRFTTNSSRGANLAELDAILKPILAARDADELSAELLNAGVPAGPANNVGEVLTHPHTAHREMVLQKNEYRGTGIAAKLSETPGKLNAVPPRFGEQNREVLAEAGYSDAEIAALLESGAILDQRR